MEKERRSHSLHLKETSSHFTADGGNLAFYNVLAAISAAYVLNVPLEAIIRSVESVAGVPGRFEAVNGGKTFQS